MLADQAPCSGKDGGITNGEFSAEELAFIGKRFLLVCHTRSPEKGRRALNLFTEPNLSSAVPNPPMIVSIDIFVDRLIAVDDEQFLGGYVFSQSRCPLVQFYVPDASGRGKHFDYWYMLSNDLTCELKQPGEE